jgi:hypothetical protein
MASIVEQQPTAGSEESAARQFWGEKMEAHPNIAGALAIAWEIAGFFLNGHCLVVFSRWILRVSGYVAESALLLAVLWISGSSVAPHLVELVMSEQTMQSFVSLALIALALIPEVILANAMVNALGHVQTATQKKTIVSWVWAALFLIPTLLFLLLTAYTLNTLVQSGGNFMQASTGMVGLRCFAGWSYGLLEMVYAGVGRRTVSQAQPILTPAQPTPARELDYEEIARQFLPLVAQEVRQAIPDTTGMVEQLQQLRANLEELAMSVATQSAAKSEPTGNQAENAAISDRVNLEVYRGEQSGNTDSLHVVNEKAATRKPRASAKKTVGSRHQNARTAAARVLKKFPDIGLSELAQRAQISKSYASKIIAERA